MENSKSMTEFWKTIGEFRTRKRRKGEGVKREVWLEHFKGLLEGVAETEGRVREGKGRGETTQEGRRQDEAEREELDREITVGEMRRAPR